MLEAEVVSRRVRFADPLEFPDGQAYSRKQQESGALVSDLSRENQLLRTAYQAEQEHCQRLIEELGQMNYRLQESKEMVTKLSALLRIWIYAP
ncbi:hypothetical protein TWF788_003244 [Orbilia oligospora]|uniref:Uncharacterized protein n=1 Tax=Orbilia oligospora TaxID=2813651 RepID=A0A7C8TZA2_ORBOL|nr:hypothetical protein TWF788_003244 [Orbilia oligospora]